MYDFIKACAISTDILRIEVVAYYKFYIFIKLFYKLCRFYLLISYNLLLYIVKKY